MATVAAAQGDFPGQNSIEFLFSTLKQDVDTLSTAEMESVASALEHFRWGVARRSQTMPLLEALVWEAAKREASCVEEAPKCSAIFSVALHSANAAGFSHLAGKFRKYIAECREAAAAAQNI